ncbi:uncharacterized protein LOC110631004 [Manihot esculenta]|uniref:Uncharacterized protein n=1 Tax=Manihot esculenta TaxID=3983 RepID=A0ACB7GET1_MANES|nr:uncharacterized protein LOC110631004 [Manihot esculenta]KAG8638379.1 hypothetical protein MANES_14G022601v8 [Manihot esculenta]
MFQGSIFNFVLLVIFEYCSHWDFYGSLVCVAAFLASIVGGLYCRFFDDWFNKRDELQKNISSFGKPMPPDGSGMLRSTRPKCARATRSPARCQQRTPINRIQVADNNNPQKALDRLAIIPTLTWRNAGARNPMLNTKEKESHFIKKCDWLSTPPQSFPRLHRFSFFSVILTPALVLPTQLSGYFVI